MNYLYFVQRKPIEDTDLMRLVALLRYPVKIGITNNLQHRLGQLDTGSPWEYQILGHEKRRRREDIFELESDYHQYFAPFRMDGEWFRPNFDLMRLLVMRGYVRINLLGLWADILQFVYFWFTGQLDYSIWEILSR